MAPKKGNLKMRKQIENKLDGTWLDLNETTAQEKAENDGAKWKVNHRGHAGGDYFKKLKDAYEFVSIELGL